MAALKAPYKAELSGIRSSTKAGAGARRMAVSELWLYERLARGRRYPPKNTCCKSGAGGREFVAPRFKHWIVNLI